MIPMQKYHVIIQNYSQIQIDTFANTLLYVFIWTDIVHLTISTIETGYFYAFIPIDCVHMTIFQFMKISNSHQPLTSQKLSIQEDFDEFSDVDDLYSSLPLDKVESLEDLGTICPPSLVKVWIFPPSAPYQVDQT